MTPSSQVLLNVRRWRGAAILLVLGCTLMIRAASAQEQIVVEGRVVADDTGQPLPGARIWLTQDQTFSRTNAQGRFEVALSAAQPTFSLTKPGYVRTFASVQKGQRNLVVRMPRGGVLTVHVSSPAGQPVQTSVGVSGGGDRGGMSVQTATDERGQVRIPNLREGRYRVSVGATSVQVRLPPRELSDAEVIRLREEMTRLSKSAKGAAPSTIDVRAGKEVAIYLVGVTPPSLGNAIDLSGAPAEKGTASVRGRVVDADGEPVPGATIIIMRGILGERTVSDASGAFRIDSLGAGTLRVAAVKPGFSMAEPNQGVLGLSVTLNEGEQRHDVVLKMVPGSEITGNVFDEFGEPVERAMVLLLRLGVGEDGRTRAVRAGAAQSDDRGRYRIPRVSAGAYALLTLGDIITQGETYLYYPGVVSLEMAHMLEVPEGRDVTGIDFRFNPELGQQVAGTVIESSGRPRTGGSAELTGTDARGVQIDQRTARITRTGAFVFLNVGPGRYTITVRSPPVSPVPQVVNGQVVRPPAAAPESGAVQIEVGNTPPDVVIVRTAPGTSAAPR